MKIQTRLFFSFTFITVVAVSITGLTGYVTAHEEIQNEVENNLVLIGVDKEHQINDFLELVGERAIDFSSDGFIRDSMHEINVTGETDIEALQNHLLTNKMGLDESIYGMNLLSPEGITVASSDLSEIGDDESDDLYFLEAKTRAYGEYYVSDVMPSTHFGEDIRSVKAAAPLFEKTSGNFVGILVNYIKPDVLQEVLTCHYTDGSNALCPERDWHAVHAYILDSNGVLIASSKNDAPVGEVIENELSQNCSIKKEQVAEYSSHLGMEVLGVNHCIEKGWSLIIELPTELAFQTLSVLKWRYLLVSVLILIAAFFSLYFPYKHFVLPIKDMHNIVKDLISGKLHKRMSVETKDELGELSAAFNTLTDQLVRFELAVEHATDHIVISDPEGTILYANPATERITGFKVKNVIGETPSLWGGKMERKFYDKMWTTIRDKKKVFKGEFHNIRKNGEPYVSEAHISPVLNEHNEVTHYVSIQRDITQQKKNQQAKEDFVSMASHQLNTPLAGIKWVLNELRSKPHPECDKDDIESLGMISQMTEHMIELVHTLLVMSRIEMGKQSIKKEPTPLNDLIQEVVHEQKHTMDHKQIKLKWKKDGNHAIKTDPRMLKEVVTNVLSNAVKYSPEQGRIHINVEALDGNVNISVSDEGLGIPKGDELKIFERFYRAQNAFTANTPGTGLGLALCCQIMKRLKGKIWAENKKGGGSLFVISLPLK